MGILSKLFGGNSGEIANLLQEGATIIDVRTADEFSYGHIDGSINIPIEQIKHKVKKIKSIKTPIVLCCASGARSANAVDILRQNGIKQVFNGGRWSKVNRLLRN